MHPAVPPAGYKRVDRRQGKGKFLGKERSFHQEGALPYVYPVTITFHKKIWEVLIGVFAIPPSNESSAV